MLRPICEVLASGVTVCLESRVGSNFVAPAEEGQLRAPVRFLPHPPFATSHHSVYHVFEEEDGDHLHPVVTASPGHCMPLPPGGTRSPWVSIRFSLMVKGKGCISDGLRLAPGSLLVSASAEQPGACEVTVGQNASWRFPGVRTCLQGCTGERDT